MEETSEPIVKVTAIAIEAIKKFMNEPAVKGTGIRMGVRGGGCAGFQYALDFSYEKPTDFVYEQDGLKIYIDPLSAVHLEGTTLDYISGLAGTGFKFENPHATKTCGCGSSYST